MKLLLLALLAASASVQASDQFICRFGYTEQKTHLTNWILSKPVSFGQEITNMEVSKGAVRTYVLQLSESNTAMIMVSDTRGASLPASAAIASKDFVGLIDNETIVDNKGPGIPFGAKDSALIVTYSANDLTTLRSYEN